MVVVGLGSEGGCTGRGAWKGRGRLLGPFAPVAGLLANLGLVGTETVKEYKIKTKLTAYKRNKKTDHSNL